MTTDLTEQRFIVGIDLGTTNCAVCYVDRKAEEKTAKRILPFQIPQLSGPGEIKRLPLLPSFYYIPGRYDLPKEAVAHPWKSHETNFAGAFARDHGSKVPARLVSSAKSWLCHAKVDRKARILPWGAGDEVRKVSAVEATSAYLKHIRLAWNSVRDEDDILEHQLVIVTVPASFDEVARELTLEAAKEAGLEYIVLLEEPLAAFYSWLCRHEHDWKEYVTPGELILVCDVGGGTTDFTLIALKDVGEGPRFERIAVGNHLILGGDNIDLTLAQRIETGFTTKKKTLSGDRWKTLCHQCRQAKESILSGATNSKRIILTGEGGRLIADTLSAELTKEIVQESILEGFFPIVGPGDISTAGVRGGITEFGLPYEPEPAITRHLGAFLTRHKDDAAHLINHPNGAPDLVLFNGGSLKPPIIQHRICQALGELFPYKPRVLVNPDLDQAVAFGAAYYGLVKVGEGVRVGSGSARAYYLGIGGENKENEVVNIRKAICLVERGLEEGSEISLGNRKFTVLTNQPVCFDLYSSSFRSGDRSGNVIDVDDSLTTLPPLQTVIKYGKKGSRRPVPIEIEANYTEVGTLSLWCRSTISNHRWQLQFQLRDTKNAESIQDEEIFEVSLVESARKILRGTFEPGSATQDMDNLVKDIAKVVDRPREEWPLGFIRTIADDLISFKKVRQNGYMTESRWMNLTGFCLRPGLGEGFDKQRLQRLWKIYKSGPIHPGRPQVRSEWWIMWRRVTAGLTPGQQRQFLQDVTPILLGKKSAAKRISRQERIEIWMAVANMEKLFSKDKLKLGRQLLSEMKTKKIPPQLIWSLSRIGARQLLYGPDDRVISPEEIDVWIKQLLQLEPSNPIALAPAFFQMARRTGDRVRDISEETRNKLLDWMDAQELSGESITSIKEVALRNQTEQVDMFGESLPVGLVLTD
jgi:molecular chaperone DnaK (HSP70)